MNIEHHTIGSLDVEICWKPIKNLHVGVYPPNGRVRVAAPTAIGLDAIRVAVLSRMAWVRRQQSKFAKQERQATRHYLSGETHYLWGRPLRLEVAEWNKSSYRISMLGSDRLCFQLPTESSRERRGAWLANWRRSQLRKVAAPKIAMWSELLGVVPRKWGIRDMRTKWGSCNAQKGIIWLNIELSKKPVAALDYVILHELAHLVSDRHDDRFLTLLDTHMPAWRTTRKELNDLPLPAWEAGRN